MVEAVLFRLQNNRQLQAMTVNYCTASAKNSYDPNINDIDNRLLGDDIRLTRSPRRGVKSQRMFFGPPTREKLKVKGRSGA